MPWPHSSTHMNVCVCVSVCVCLYTVPLRRVHIDATFFSLKCLPAFVTVLVAVIFVAVVAVVVVVIVVVVVLLAFCFTAHFCDFSIPPLRPLAACGRLLCLATEVDGYR